MKNLILILAVLLSIQNIKAQSEDTTDFAYQFSFLPMIGTDGTVSQYKSYNYSFNLVGGHIGELDGIELGCFVNSVKGRTSGCQISGFSNISGGELEGCQITGFSNTVIKQANGAQFSGFSNVALSDSELGQFSGFSNFNRGELKGIQASGFSNTVTKDFEGAQINGFSNVILGKLEGAQLSGMSNVCLDSINGAQIAGLTNYSHQSIKGVQIAGLSNIALDVEGSQISGGINIAKNVKGSQIGLINIANEVDGVCLGLVCIIRNGYKTLEISQNESFIANVRFKTGTNGFYNIFSASADIVNDVPVWAYGYGIGTSIKFNDKNRVSLDLTANNVHTNSWYIKRLHMLNKLELTYSLSLLKHVKLNAGVSLNMQVRDLYKPLSNDEIKADLVTRSIYNNEHWDIESVFYPGIHFGIAF